MPKHTVSCSAKCPFYRCEERHEIFCSGIKPGMATHVAFAVPLEKKNWMKSYCKADYSACPYEKMLEKQRKE